MQFIEEEKDRALKHIEDISTTTVERKKKTVRQNLAPFCVSILYFMGQMSDEWNKTHHL